MEKEGLGIEDRTITWIRKEERRKEVEREKREEWVIE